MIFSTRFILFAALFTLALHAHCETPKADRAAPSIRAAPNSSDHQLSSVLAAEFAAADGRKADAATLYLKASRSEKRADYAERAARLALGARDFGLAETAAALWLSLAPGELAALQTQAFALIVQGKRDDALVKVRALLLNPAPDAANVAIALLTAPDARGLSVSLLEALKDEPKLRALPVERGLVPLSLRLKQNELAYELVQAQVKTEPENSRAWLWQALTEVALARGAQAADSYAKALALDPKNVRLRLSYVQVLNELKRDADIERVLKAAPEPDEALFQARIALALLNRDGAKSSAGTSRRSGDTANMTGVTPAGKKALKRLAAELERTQGLELSARQTLLGQIFELSEQPQKALEWYRAVSPATAGAGGERWPNAQMRIAVVQAKSDLAAASKTLAALQNAEVPEQAQVDAYLLDAELMAQAKNLNGAAAVLSRALERLPEDTGLLYARAMNAFARDDIAGLERDLTRVIELDPRNAQALNALGYSLLDKTTRLEEATDYIQQALYLEPNSPAIMDSLGWAYFKRGQFDQAIVQLRTAYEAQPDDEIAAHLCEALMALGAEPEAREVWTEALARFPESEPLKAAIKRFTSGKTP
jgi:tetratricopeptide (TPR) repeat protein